MNRQGAHLPADLIPLADLVHPIGEGAKDGEEHGGGAGARCGDPARVAHGREPAGRRPVLHQRHLLDAGHPRLVPNPGLRHLGCSVRTPAPPACRSGAPRGSSCVGLGTDGDVVRVSEIEGRRRSEANWGKFGGIASRHTDTYGRVKILISVVSTGSLS
jgi:hypothetical protein